MEQRVNVEENKEEQEEGHQDHRSSARIAVGDNTNNMYPATPMTFDHLIDRVVDIYKANNTVLNVLNTLHMEVIVNDPNINATTTGVEVLSGRHHQPTIAGMFGPVHFRTRGEMPQGRDRHVVADSRVVEVGVG